MSATAKRPYRMAARADAAALTAERILAAAEGLFWERPTDQLSLEELAARAGVAKQTILRRFGSKDGVLAAAAERALARTAAERGDISPGDLDGAVRRIVAHYEHAGEGVLRMLAEEARNPGVRALADRGRALHAAWCEQVFAPALGPLRGAARRRRLAQLVALTDVHTWKLLRHDRGLGRAQTELALRELLEPLAGART